MNHDRVKRGLDVVVGGVVLMASLPLQAVLAALVRRRLGSPVLFRQKRVGRGDEVFELVKFRTMREPDVGAGLVRDEDRMTPFGQFLRSTSLDELPTLWNVVVGDMSLVGPRPLLVHYLQHYSPRQRKRHDVRPGVTGLAQVSGRNALSWPERLELDVEYVERRSLWLDLTILWRTVAGVLRRDGISADGHVTMPEFRGEQP